MEAQPTDDLYDLLKKLIYGGISSGDAIAQLASEVEESRLEIEHLKTLLTTATDKLAARDETIAQLRSTHGTT